MFVTEKDLIKLKWQIRDMRTNLVLCCILIAGAFNLWTQQRLIASAHIAHNTIDIPLGMGFGNRLPVDFQWFPDGLAVSAATADYRQLLGARVLQHFGMLGADRRVSP
jgi:hypothetical protein